MGGAEWQGPCQDHVHLRGCQRDRLPAPHPGAELREAPAPAAPHLRSVPSLASRLHDVTVHVTFLFLENVYFFGCAGSQLRHVGSVATCRILLSPTLSCSVWDLAPDQVVNLSPCSGSVEP